MHHKDENHCFTFNVFSWWMNYCLVGMGLSPSLFMGFLLLADNHC